MISILLSTVVWAAAAFDADVRPLSFSMSDLQGVAVAVLPPPTDFVGLEMGRPILGSEARVEVRQGSARLEGGGIVIRSGPAKYSYVVRTGGGMPYRVRIEVDEADEPIVVTAGGRRASVPERTRVVLAYYGPGQVEFVRRARGVVIEDDGVAAPVVGGPLTVEWEPRKPGGLRLTMFSEELMRPSSGGELRSAVSAKKGPESRVKYNGGFLQVHRPRSVRTFPPEHPVGVLPSGARVVMLTGFADLLIDGKGRKLMEGDSLLVP